jgi:predicted secreted protein
MLEIDERQDGREFDVAIEQIFELRLSENPTTGYRWRLNASDPSEVEVISDTFEPSSSAPGASGFRRWQLKTSKNPGDVTVRLDRLRSWERQPAQSFAIKLHVSAS